MKIQSLSDDELAFLVSSSPEQLNARYGHNKWMEFDFLRIHSECLGRFKKALKREKLLVDALQALHDDVAEYQRINNLGGYDNHCMVQARSAIEQSKGTP